jgi:2-aminoadipate transaminase
VLFPGLRVGYLVAPRPLLEKLALARFNADGGTSAVAQAALAALLAGGGLERHLRRVRKVYGERLAAMRDALAASMPAGTAWTAPRGGHVVWLTLPDGADAERLLQAAHAAGIVYTPGTAFYWDGRGQEHAMLSFANVTPSAIREGVGLLGDLVRKFTTPARRRAAR